MRLGHNPGLGLYLLLRGVVQESRLQRGAPLEGVQGDPIDRVKGIHGVPPVGGENTATLQYIVPRLRQVHDLKVEVRRCRHPSTSADLLQQDPVVPREPLGVVGEVPQDLRLGYVERVHHLRRLGLSGPLLSTSSGKSTPAASKTQAGRSV